MGTDQRLTASALLCVLAACAPQTPAPSAPIAAASTATPINCGDNAAACAEDESPAPGEAPRGTACQRGSAWQSGECAPLTCPEGSRQSSSGICERTRTKTQAETLNLSIQTTEKAYHDSMFKDLELAVELARLQLLRDEKTNASDTDAAEALRNAQRAAATDASRPLSRLVLALVQARGMLDLMANKSPEARGIQLRIFQQLVESSLIQASGPEAAAMHSLVGFIQLDLGNAAAAKASFLSALHEHPRFAAAELGLGDVARASGDFGEARSAYARCLSLDPQNPGAKLGLAAVQRGTRLKLEAAPELPAKIPTLDVEPLADTKTTPNLCDATAHKSTPALCDALHDLEKADTADRSAQAARTVIDEVKAQACFAQQTRCDSYIRHALMEAAKAFSRGNDWAKTIIVSKVALANPDFRAVHNEAFLLTADAYYRIGIANMAANFYARYSEPTELGTRARLRGFLLLLIIATPQAIRDEAKRLAKDRRIPGETRRAVIDLGVLLQPGEARPKALSPLGVAEGLSAILETPSWSPASSR
ncbi:MAG: tetratricopeptide repeat protein [Polyangiaceae bacterium]